MYQANVTYVDDEYVDNHDYDDADDDDDTDNDTGDDTDDDLCTLMGISILDS